MTDYKFGKVDKNPLDGDIEQPDYKKLYEELLKQSDELKQQIELLKKDKKVEKLVKHSDYNFGRNKSLPKNDIDDEMNIIIKECNLFQPETKTKDECDFIEIKKGVYQNKKTNKEYTVAKSLVFDGKLF